MKLELKTDLAREPFSVFFREAILRTPQGLVFLAGAVTYLVLASLSCLSLHLIGLPEGSLTIHLVLFLGWTIISFVVFVGISDLVNYQPNWVVAGITCLVTFLPLFWVYT
ncbi:MAG: hypothetical protein V3U87_13265 [Methylococcaceae bacterium]